MKKELIVFLILLTIIVVVSLTLRYKFPDKKNKYSKELDRLLNNKVFHGEITNVRYSKSGDMNGNIDSIDIDLKRKILTKEYSIGIGEENTITTYKITNEDVTNIINIIEKYNFIGWKDLPFNEDEVVLDASVTSLYFVTTDENNKYLSNSINYDTKIPKDGYPLLKEYTDYIFSLLKEENIIEVKILDGKE